jgi:hypothetical protein
MAGSYNLFDGQQLTSECSSRNGEKIQYLQIHHGTILSISGLISLMMPGGRDVSANGALANDGFLWEVAPATQRAFTSGVAWFDRISFTVECCNVSLAPYWGISAATRTRLAKLAVAMYKAGLLGSLTRQHIIGHNEVPGTYATACPGPDMHLDWIVAEANRLFAAEVAGEVPVPIIKEVGNVAQRSYYARVDAAGKDNGEWMLAGVDIGPLNENGTVEEKKQDGYRITMDKEVAKVWARQYSRDPEKTEAIHLTRDLYIRQQEFAREDAKQWRALMRSLLGGS